MMMPMRTATVMLLAICHVYAATVSSHRNNFLTGFVAFPTTINNNNEKFLQRPPAKGPAISSIVTMEMVRANNEDFRDRRHFLATAGMAFMGAMTITPTTALAADDVPSSQPSDIIVVATGDIKKLFNEGRALEAQGNILAAQRLYTKVTKIAPRFIYGWSSLGNTLVAQGDLNSAETTYTQAIDLCNENNKNAEISNGKQRQCSDLYLLLLNRGSVRLNNQMPKEALADLSLSSTLRARPDAVLLQNLARAQEINGFYYASDKSYDTAISMTANEVNPFWIRSSMVKFQLGDNGGAMDLMKRVDNRFSEAPEVRAAYATMLWKKGGEENEDNARKKFLEIPDRQRLKFRDEEYLNSVISWPPVMKEGVTSLSMAVGDAAAAVAAP